jgi:hypothetical protein
VNRSVRRSMCSAMLVMQGVVLFLTGVVTIGMTDLGVARSLALGVGLAVLCVVAAGLLGRPGGYALGWLVQVVSLALGLVVTAMFFVGAVFAVLLGAAYVLGVKIDRERAERAALEREWRAEHSPGAGTGG